MGALQEGKFFFDELFLSGWTITPIQFAAQDFSGKNLPAWVNIVFTPYQTSNASIGPKGKLIYATVTVVGWAENDVLAMELADQIAEFMDAGVLPSIYSIKQTNIIDHGWDASNKAYTITQFAIQYYSGDCSPVATCVNSVGDQDGRAYHLNQPWLVDCPMFTL